MLPLGLLFLLAAAPLEAFAAEAASSTFAEALTVRPLPDGKVDALFSFSLNSTVNDAEGSSHDTLAPSLLLAALRSHQADSFELALTAGTWQHSRWGYPLGETGGSGAEMWASMGDAPNPDERHVALTHALSGLFCASLGQSLTNTFTTRPYIPHLTAATEHLPYHTTSPPSGLCTENLTPFLKLLPSKGKSGLAGLLKSHRVLAGQWSSMKVSVWHEGEAVRMELGFEVVWDLVGRSHAADARDLSLDRVFKASLPRPFPPAQSSSLHLLLPEKAAGEWTIDVAADAGPGLQMLTWDLKAVEPGFDFHLKYASSRAEHYSQHSPSLPLAVRRNVLGADQTEGAFELVITNTEAKVHEIILMEEWPWWIGGWLSERQVFVDGQARNDAVRSLSYTPSIPHQRPTTLLSHLVLAPNSTTRLRTPFLKQFLEYGEHPPDASRGFELAPAVVFPLDQALPKRIYSANALVDLPVPDFSMPYNVIIMTSTLLALFFGSIFNILTRRLVAVKVGAVTNAEKDASPDDASL